MNTRCGILYILRDDRGILSIGSARNAADLPRYDVDKVKLYWGHTLNVERDMMLATTYFGNPRLVLPFVLFLIFRCGLTHRSAGTTRRSTTRRSATS